MCEMMDKMVEASKSKDGQVHKVYDDKAGHYEGNVEGHRVKEPAAKPHDGGMPSPMKISGGK